VMQRAVVLDQLKSGALRGRRNERLAGAAGWVADRVRGTESNPAPTNHGADGLAAGEGHGVPVGPTLVLPPQW